MMKIFPILLLLIISCGYKTLPTPYPSISEGLIKVQKENLYFEGGQLVLEWQSPIKLPLEDSQVSKPEKEDIKKIRLFQLKIFTPSTCPACDDQLIETIEILNSHFTQEIKQQGIIIQKNRGNSFKVLIPSKQLIGYDRYPLIYFTIDYYTYDGDLSPLSKKLYPKRPLVIPVPDIKWKIVTTDALKQETEAERFDIQNTVKKDAHLLINWEPPLEKEVHEISDNKAFKIINKYYGLVLFSINKNDEVDLISPEPLYNGRFLIIDITRQIWAKYQDRFGNYSDNILLYTP
jgi:hypothetical protein